MSRPLAIGWIGCGRHAQAMLLPHLAQLDIRLAAVCDIDAKALQRTASRYGVEGTYSDPADLLAHQGLDAVGLAFGPEAYEKLAVMALERGLAVFMEKPPAASAAGC